MGRGSMGGGARKTACPYTDYRDHTPSIALLYPSNQLLSHSTFILNKQYATCMVLSLPPNPDPKFKHKTVVGPSTFQKRGAKMDIQGQYK